MSNTAKEEMLTRIRQALATAPEPVAPVPAFRLRDERDRGPILEDFIERLLDYKAQVTTTSEADLLQEVTRACLQHHIERLVVPNDLPATLIPPDLTVRRDEPLIPIGELDTIDGVLTGCALAIAQTGTIILDGGTWQGRRALSLVPDCHLCIVREEQVVGLVPEAITRLSESATRPLTFISGPSATSDIELNRVEGVHGPRLLHVFVVRA